MTTPDPVRKTAAAGILLIGIVILASTFFTRATACCTVCEANKGISGIHDAVTRLEKLQKRQKEQGDKSHT